MESKLDYDIRLGTTDDLPFILSSWTGMIGKLYPNQYALDFKDKYKSYLHSLLPTCLTIVAHLSGEPNEILGYLVYSSFRQQLVVHYTYVKLDARRQGIANAMLQFANPINTSIIFTHPANNEKVMQHFSKSYIFDPSISILR